MAGDDYGAWLQQQFGEVIDELELGDREKRFLRSRWLDQIVWLERKAKDAQRRYYALRLIAIVGGLIVPALVSLNVAGEAAAGVAWTTFAVSLVVAIAVAIEGFFHYGDRWRHYRRTVELMKSQGWQLYELAGAYAGYRSHRTAFRTFATAVEGLIAEDVDVYVSKVVRERPREDEAEPEQDG